MRPTPPRVARLCSLLLVLTTCAPSVRTLSVPSASATTYYALPLDQTANRSCAAATNSTTPIGGLANGARCLVSGDTLTLKDGTYVEVLDGSEIPSGSSPSQMTIVQAEHSRHALIDARSSTTSGGVFTLGQRASGGSRAYIKVQGIVVDATGRGGSFNHTVIYSDTSCVQGGPYTGCSHDISFLDIELKGGNPSNSLSGITAFGLQWGQYNILLQGSHLHHIGWIGSDTSNTEFDYGAYMGSVYQSIFDGNEFDHIEGYAIQMYCDHNDCNDWIIRNNYVHDVGSAGILFSCGGKRNQLYNNIFARVGLRGNSGSQAYQGTGSQQGGIMLGPSCGGASSDQATIYNNTLVNNYGDASGGYPPCVGLSTATGATVQNTIVRNNLCWGNSPNDTLSNNGSAQGSNILDHNLCSGVSGTGNCSGITYANPQFAVTIPQSDLTTAGITKESFKISSSSSPAVGVGVSVGVATDIGGQTRSSSTPTLGAWEFGAPNTHTVCTGGSCVSVSGPGVNACAQTSDCASSTLPPEVLRWKMNEGTGTTTQDSTGNGYAGTLVGPPTWAPGREGPHSLTFDGATTFVQNTALAWPSGSPMSVALWVNAPSLSNNTGAFGVGSSDRPNRFGMHVPWGGDGKLKCNYGNDLAGGEVAVNMAPYIGKWIHVACTSDGTNQMRLYINGQQVASGTPATAPGALTGLEVGRWRIGASTFYDTGGIDDFRLYSVVLTPTQVLQLYMQDAGRYRHVPLDLH